MDKSETKQKYIIFLKFLKAVGVIEANGINFDKSDKDFYAKSVKFSESALARKRLERIDPAILFGKKYNSMNKLQQDMVLDMMEPELEELLSKTLEKLTYG